MDFEDGRPVTTRDIPKVLLGFAVVLALWPAVFPSAHPLLAKGKLQSVSGSLHRIVHNDADRSEVQGTFGGKSALSGNDVYYYPGSVDLYVLNRDGIREFSLDNRQALRSPRLQELRTGDELNVLVEPVPSGQDRLWELRHHDDTIVDYADTYAYTAQIYGNPPFWCRVFSLVLVFAAAASAWLLRVRPSAAGRPADDPHREVAADAASRRDPASGAAAPIAVGNPAHAEQEALPTTEPGPIPPVLVDVAATHPVAVMLALLLDDAIEARVDQQMRVRQKLGMETLTSLNSLAPVIGRLHPSLRTPLAERVLPALAGLSEAVSKPFLECVDATSGGEGMVGLSRYCLGRSVHRQFDGANGPVASDAGIADARHEIALLIATTARAAHGSTEASQRAYLSGMRRILPDRANPGAPVVEGFAELDDGWARLEALAPAARAKVVDGVVAAIGAEGTATSGGLQLVHAVSLVLRHPYRD